MTTDTLIVGGGQAGLATAHTLARAGRAAVLLEAGPEPVGSWPRYYDSLTLFSPARFSELPGLRFPGDRNRYPHRDEVIEYLRRYAERLESVDIRTDHPVESITREDDTFIVHAAGREPLVARHVIAATGGFGRAHWPHLPGLDTFTGTVVHAGAYTTPGPFAGQRVVIVGGGNTAVQVGYELAQHARVTLATRRPLTFANPNLLGRDLHWWVVRTGLDRLPLGPHLRGIPTVPVADPGHYRRALEVGEPDRRPLFTALEGRTVTWADGTSEEIDTLILATGYRPAVDYLKPLGALDRSGSPLHRAGLSTAVPGLGFVGLEWQRSFGSATLRGVGRDARYVTKRLRQHANASLHPLRPAEAEAASRRQAHGRSSM